MVAMCATMFTACSDDDDKDPLDDDGEGKEGVITMVYEDEDAGLWIGVETFNEGEIITIDWGDGNVEEFKSIRIYEDWDEDGEDEIHYVIDNDSWNEGEIRHEYHDSNKPYTITVKGKIKGWYCWDNLTLLDVSKCPALTELGCGYNNLTSLDVSKNTALTELNCYENNLTSLNVSGCTALTYLDCSPNNLTSLDVSKNTALTYLSCGYNNLTSLDVSKNTALTDLSCSCNDLTSLNVSGCTALTWLDCGGNNLTSLDVSKNTKLTELSCSSNNLTSAALNQIFRDLPQVTSGTIYMSGNPGTETCDKSIAENKGWRVI